MRLKTESSVWRFVKTFFSFHLTCSYLFPYPVPFCDILCSEHTIYKSLCSCTASHFQFEVYKHGCARSNRTGVVSVMQYLIVCEMVTECINLHNIGDILPTCLICLLILQHLPFFSFSFTPSYRKQTTYQRWSEMLLKKALRVLSWKT